MVLAFIFRSIIHCKLIFICGVRLGSRFVYFAIQTCSCLNIICYKALSFAIVFLCQLVKIQMII